MSGARNRRVGRSADSGVLLIAVLAGLAAGFGIGLAAPLADPLVGLGAVLALALAASVWWTRRREAAGTWQRLVTERAWRELRREILRSRRRGHQLTLLRLEPAEADRRPLLAALRRELRRIDTPWLAGEELFVLLPETTLEAARSTIVRIRSAVPALTTTAIGSATFPEDGLTLESLVLATRGARIDLAAPPVTTPSPAAAIARELSPSAAGGRPEAVS